MTRIFKILGTAPLAIALTFGITEHKVTQRLALANLLPAIRDLFRCDAFNLVDGFVQTEEAFKVHFLPRQV